MSGGRNVPPDASVRTGLDEEALAAGVADKLHFQQAVPAGHATPHDWYMALALTVRDRLVERHARVGRFSSDRSIREYCRDIWHVEPVAPGGGRPGKR